uniref:Uncharacterized protein n=1 Tax=Parascaris univalens TaxID=6257 RepID=A0A915AUS6_PARUN
MNSNEFNVFFHSIIFSLRLQLQHSWREFAEKLSLILFRNFHLH